MYVWVNVVPAGAFLHHLLLGLLTSYLVTAAITICLKIPVGELRPDFNARWVQAPHLSAAVSTGAAVQQCVPPAHTCILHHLNVWRVCR